MTTASPAAGISPEFIDQIRAKLSRTTVEHYINGKWTEGARGETFETLDPSTNRVLARAWRGHAEDIDRAAQAAHAAFPKVGPRQGQGSQEVSAQDRQPDRKARRRTGHYRMPGRRPGAQDRSRANRAHRGKLQLLRRIRREGHGRPHLSGGWRVAQLQPARAGGPVRHHHALERADDAFHLAHRSRARHRQHRHLETGRVVAAHRLEARADFRRGRPAARRVQRGARLRRGSGRAAGGSSAGPAHHADRRNHHRLHRDEGRGRSIEAPVARAGRQIARRDFRRRRSRPRARRHRLPDLQLQRRALHRQFTRADRRIDLRRIHRTSGGPRRAASKSAARSIPTPKWAR